MTVIVKSGSTAFDRSEYEVSQPVNKGRKTKARDEATKAECGQALGIIKDQPLSSIIWSSAP